MGKTKEPSRWYLLWDKDRKGNPVARIRRNIYPNGKLKYESISASKYRHLQSEAELQHFLEQLNHRHKSALQRARERYAFDHKFITQAILDKFRDDLISDTPDKAHARNIYMALERDCLHWFISKLGLPDPIDWKRYEKPWGHALKNELDELEGLRKERETYRIFEENPHPDTIKKRIQIMNRFLGYLHSVIPETVPAIRLEPISKPSMKKYKADYLQSGEYEPGRFIEDKDWKVIESKIDKRIRRFIQIGYYFGLRRAECLGLKRDDLYEDCVKVERQLVAFPDEPEYGPTKNRQPRLVPYWMLPPDELYELIPDEKDKMYPGTLGVLFAEEMKRLKMPYKMHDLRRTFITKAFRLGKLPRDIQLAVGHADLSTTLLYAKDDRGLTTSKRFVPKKKTG